MKEREKLNGYVNLLKLQSSIFKRFRYLLKAQPFLHIVIGLEYKQTNKQSNRYEYGSHLRCEESFYWQGGCGPETSVLLFYIVARRLASGVAGLSATLLLVPIRLRSSIFSIRFDLVYTSSSNCRSLSGFVCSKLLCG